MLAPDRQREGNRPPLVRLIHLEEESLVHKNLGIVFLALLAALLVWTIVDREPAPIELVERAAEAPAGVPEPSTELEEPLAAAVEQRREVSEVAPASGTTELAAATAPAASDGLSELRGRFLLPDGSPAAQVLLQVRGWQANQERVNKYGLPDAFDAPSGTSGADGRFSIRFDPPRAYQFVLEGALNGFCKASWRWPEIEPDKVVDVGDVTLVRGGAVRGRIVDAQGRSLTEGWVVYGNGARVSTATDAEPVRVRASPDASTGEFVLEGLPPGRVSLRAHSRVANWIDGPSVDVVAGTEVRGDIPYTGPDISSRITVITFSRPFYIFESMGGTDTSIVLTAPGFEERVAKKIPNSSQSHSFEDVPPGSYTVEVRDPRYRPWSKSGVRPGQSVDAKLVGNSSVVLNVVDDATGDTVERYSLDVRIDKTNWSPSTFRILEARQEPPRNGLFEGLIAHDQTLIVAAEGYAPCEVPVPGLAPNELRNLTARLTRGRTLGGHVVQGASKRPVADVKVEMRLLLAPDESTDSFFQPRVDSRETRTDADGAFTFSGIGNGTYEIEARASSLVRGKTTAVVSPESDPKSVELSLPDTGRVVGRILAPEGASFAGLRALTTPAAKDPLGREELDWMFLPPEAFVDIAQDGTFQSPQIPAGGAQVYLRCPDVTIPNRNGSMGFQGDEIHLGGCNVTAGADTQQEFDLREGFPTSPTARVRLNGRPGAALVLSFFAESRTGAVAVADSNGTCRVGPMKPDTYRVRVSPIDNEWVYDDPRSFTLGSGASPTIEFDVMLHAGELVCRNASTHEPLAAQRLFLTPVDTDRAGNATAKTDAAGRVRLSLPAGRWKVGAKPSPFPGDSKGSVIVNWGPQGGSPREIELETRGD